MEITETVQEQTLHIEQANWNHDRWIAHVRKEFSNKNQLSLPFPRTLKFFPGKEVTSGERPFLHSN